MSTARPVEVAAWTFEPHEGSDRQAGLEHGGPQASSRVEPGRCEGVDETTELAQIRRERAIEQVMAGAPSRVSEVAVGTGSCSGSS